MGYIYLRSNKLNGKQYVGQVEEKQFNIRQSKWNNLNQPYAGPAINRARAKYGLDAFSFEILKECEDEELDQLEIYYIKELNTKAPNGYNLTDGGGGCRGYVLSEEAKRKISEKNKGRKHSEEWKRKHSEDLKGRHPSEETKQKIREGQKNKKPMSEEARRKMSEERKGIPNIKLSKPLLQIDKNTNEIIAEFPSVMEAERQLGLRSRHISACCRGERKSAYGYIWRYKI